MINPFPPEYDLVSFFETLPTYTDTDLPIEYRRATYVRENGDERIEVAIEPSYEDFELEWRRSGELVLALDLHGVRGIKIDRERDHDELVLRFGEDRRIEDLRIRVRPTPSVRWGTRHVHDRDPLPEWRE